MPFCVLRHQQHSLSTLLAPLWNPPLRQPGSPEFSLRDSDKSLRMQAESLTHFLMSECCKGAQRLCIRCTPPTPYSYPHHPNCHLLTRTHARTSARALADNGAFVSSLTHSPTDICPLSPICWSAQIVSECLF